MFFVKSPWWLKRIYSDFVWRMPATKPHLYLTFDDGPHEQATPFVLNELAKFNAKATFFCIGKNILSAPGIYEQVVAEGHSVGNHTHNHLNGWKTSDRAYIENILEASRLIPSPLFRPPYGRISRFQARALKGTKVHGDYFRTIMWDVLSGDFDQHLDPSDCLLNVVRNAGPGSIIVFHDSAKAYPNLVYTLPKVLQYYHERGFLFKSIEHGAIKQGGPE